ncbi:hypothetical protein [Rhizobium sp. N324]|uniref:hypothetical protein n=1 Tax=Rhizobium sp. N324 TaxID=1703969 RepID=UPI00167CB2C2|nr:hypothetical protein [Rhizobium sp. N324]
MIVKIDEAIPVFDLCCGLEPQAVHGPTSIISCTGCGEKITVETAPFFRSAATQLEHQTWRAAVAWNEKRRRVGGA